jgi:DNA-binding IclR family transcriptional regulator
VSQSLERALDLVELIREGHATLDELAARVRVHKTTVLRLLRVLEVRGYVTRDAQHRYRIGPALYAFAGGRPDHEAVRAAAAEPMRALGRLTGQTVHLAAYDDGVVTYIDKVEATDKLRMYSRIGLPAPLHATAVAKVLLGALDEAELGRILDRIEYTRYTPRTLDTPEALAAEVRRSAERGWAVDHEEHETFMNCIGAGVRGADGGLIAAVSVSVPNVVLPYDGVLEFLPALRDTVVAISADLGFRDAVPFVLPDAAASTPA